MAAEYIINPQGAPAEPSQETGTDPGNAGAAAGGGGADLVKNGSVATFMADVIETSTQVPVIVDFWAPWCGPCKQLGPAIEKLVRQAGGVVRLVKINVDENQELAQQMRVQSIPAVYAFKNGQPVDGFVGALPESQLRAFIEKLTGNAEQPLDKALDQADAALAGGDAAAAAALYSEILAHDTTNPRAVAGLIRSCTAAGEAAKAEELIDGLTPELRSSSEVAAAISAMELAEESTASGDVAEFRQKLAGDENDHQARFDLAVALYGAGDAENAIAELVELVRRDRQWNDDAARKQLVKIFEALGHADPLTVAGRQRLSTILFS
ncbi:MAG: thioredoxin [Rhodospirillales bacterium]|jgi:putative thioredoxin|nr:thioredoxin [Rhodospirillales bacterium]MDP6773575.1 thioredoxin [Rhodospirillales bacterium]